MAMAAFALWILDALSLLYPSISPSSSSGSSSISPSSSCVQLNVGPIVLPTVLDQQQLSSAETALTCDSGLPSYEETMNPRWIEGTLDCHLNQNLCRWEPVGFELPHNYNSYFHWKLFSSLCTWSYTQQRHWLQTFDPCQGCASFAKVLDIVLSLLTIYCILDIMCIFVWIYGIHIPWLHYSSSNTTTIFN